MSDRALGRVAVAGLAALALAACGTAGRGQGPAGIQPREGRSGLTLSGTFQGRQLAVNDGAPRMRVDDCDPNTGRDVDLCLFTRDLDGAFIGIIVENPEVLREAATLQVDDPACASPEACDAVRGVAIVELQRGVGTPRVRATGGTMAMRVVQPRMRYAGTMNLTFRDGRLAGSFDIVPRPEQ